MKKNLRFMLFLIVLVSMFQIAVAEENPIFNDYVYSSEYNNGYAWICFSNEQNNYIAVIDKNGKMLYKYNLGEEPDWYMVKNTSRFDNGYMYYTSGNELIFLSPAGKVLRYLDDYQEDNYVLAYGDGYVLTKTAYADFSNMGNIYTIYDENGNIVSQIDAIGENTYEGVDDAQYHGNGVFSVSFHDNNHLYKGFYFVENEKFVKILYEEDNGLSFNWGSTFAEGEDSICIGYEYVDANTFALYFLNLNGEIEKIYSEYFIDSNGFELVVSDNKCIYVTNGGMYGENKQLAVCDLVTKEVSLLNPENEDRINWDYMSELPCFRTGKMVIPLIGADGNSYIEVIDENGMLLLEPTLGDWYSNYSNDRLVLVRGNDRSIYDENLGLVFSVEGLPFDADIYYYDDVLRVSSEEADPCYLDKNGYQIFDEIGMDEVVEIYAEDAVYEKTDIAILSKSFLDITNTNTPNFETIRYSNDESINEYNDGYNNDYNGEYNFEYDNEYVIADSNSRYLTEEEIMNLSLQKINYAKNEIYARHGRIFNSPELRNYFSSKSWYCGTIDPANFSDGLLNNYEIANAGLLAEIEFSISPNGYQLDQ